jgi:membrane-associated phospholipid phosphatase
MKALILLVFCSLLTNVAFSQNDSPYRTSFKKDGPVIVAGVGLSYLGLTLIKNKDDLTTAEVLSKSKSNVNFFDRGTAGYYSNKADKDSYIPFYGSFAMPIVMLLNHNERSKAGQVLTLYFETMAITGAMYTLTAGSVQRSRPFVYSANAPMDERMDKKAQRSFFAGHTAATAAATFFAAKVFQDFNPDSRAKPYVWVAAAAIPATVGYLRLKSGRHFLSDNLLGYAVGAASGILVPQLHKKSTDSGISLTPIVSPYSKGASLSYTF